MNNTRELENLNIDPLIIAKFFYEKGAGYIALVQSLIYLSFINVLKKENVLLFEEDFQAYLGGVVIESVFEPMSDHLDKYGSDYGKLFSSVPNIENKLALPYLEEVWCDYQNHKKNKKEYVFFEKVLNKPWQLARHNLTDELDHRKIELSNILEN